MAAHPSPSGHRHSLGLNVYSCRIVHSHNVLDPAASAHRPVLILEAALSAVPPPGGLHSIADIRLERWATLAARGCMPAQTFSAPRCSCAASLSLWVGYEGVFVPRTPRAVRGSYHYGRSRRVMESSVKK